MQPGKTDIAAGVQSSILPDKSLTLHNIDTPTTTITPTPVTTPYKFGNISSLTAHM